MVNEEDMAKTAKQNSAFTLLVVKMVYKLSFIFKSPKFKKKKPSQVTFDLFFLMALFQVCSEEKNCICENEQ
jgi:hypothetical protein